ncbi:hypothetical protein JOD54_003934 [Actinokineospora baliensis]|uniref:NACHT domain-containing protein n=1 Tax=Actinokineospora baliensis TaxID=547056 RepID=UPI001EF86658|nr:AAA family ATPase [Actinokineospora baliensis]MBM7773730.1 hypothetical protein [Actinokineospora baliensis]
MRPQPDLTFAEALRLLDRDAPGFVDKLDKALGVAVLGSGVVAGLAALGTPLAPLAVLACVWGWVDQKNEGIKLLRAALKPARFVDKRGRERRDLLESAHSLLVASSLLEVLVETLGPKTVKRLAITKADRTHIATGAIAAQTESALDALYRAQIPAPSRGFVENLPAVRSWLFVATGRTAEVLARLKADFTLAIPSFIENVLARYESRFLELAADIPEFALWSSLNEHAATRGILAAHTETLSRLESLLSLTTSGPELNEDLRALHLANRAVLSHPILDADAERYGVDVVFPTVERGFVTPHYQVKGKRWEDQPRKVDLDVMLAAHLTSATATRTPLLVLGHPGAGKSLLTKVIAARLPTSNYTVVRVPLRNVDATAPIIDQIQQALDKSTHLRTSWPRLAHQSADTVRVVLLDGLDELLQAVDRPNYLREVREFQRVEREQERPVAVLVTSRTVVADRVATPADTTVIRLAEFNLDQVRDWLARWQATNPGVREPSTLPNHLAEQPLLLLMVALYLADPSTPNLDRGLSQSALYERIFDNFTRREARKDKVAGALDDAVATQLERLSIAAFGMFNRGTQSISEDGLTADLTALTDYSGRSGERLLGKFFFIHSAEALTQRRTRTYEFLHATFGEFLIARQLLHELTRAAQVAKYNRGDPNDAMLFALLSHQFLAQRSTILASFEQLLSAENRAEVERTVLTLLRAYHNRTHSTQYDAYRPTEVDHVRQLAVYSANLATLARLFGGLRHVSEHMDPALWEPTVRLWRTQPDCAYAMEWLSMGNNTTAASLDYHMANVLRDRDLVDKEVFLEQLRIQFMHMGKQQLVREFVRFLDATSGASKLSAEQRQALRAWPGAKPPPHPPRPPGAL